MFKILAQDALPHSRRLRKYFLANPDFLLWLSRQPAAELSADLEEKFSLVLHDMLIDGVWKRTRRGRLQKTVDAICARLGGIAASELQVLDLGASDGITTWELVEAIRSVYPGRVAAWLADLNLYLHRYRRGAWVEYRSAAGAPVMVRLGRLALRLTPHHVGNDRRPKALARLYLSCSDFRRGMALDAEIPMIHPRAAQDAGITPIRLDCLQNESRLSGRIDVVRASNILNSGYFSPAQIAAALSHLHGYLKPGGLLVISRNVGADKAEEERGSVWLRREGYFEWQEDFGGGSEIKSQVDAWRAGDNAGGTQSDGVTQTH